MQRIMDVKFCKTHTEEKGEYYIVNQPWNKLCKKCALNRAVCGYKIQKDLSPQEFQNKLVLSSLVQQLKISIQWCEKKGDLYAAFSQRINNEIVASLSPLLKNIDEQLKELNQMRGKIVELYDAQILQKLNKCHEVKSRYFMDSMTFKKHLQNLQANYCDIIMNGKSEQEEQQFTRQTQLIRNQIENSRKLQNLEDTIINQTYFENIKRQFKAKYNQFESKFRSFKIQFKQDEPNLQTKALQTKGQNNDTKVSVNRFYLPEGPQKQKIFFPHRKNSSSMGLEQNRAPSITPSSQLTHRSTNLTLKSSKRNNSIPLKAKISKEQTFDFKF